MEVSNMKNDRQPKSNWEQLAQLTVDLEYYKKKLEQYRTKIEETNALIKNKTELFGKIKGDEDESRESKESSKKVSKKNR